MPKRLKFAGKGAIAVALVAGGAVAALALQPSAAVAQKFHMKIGMATINDPQQEWGEKIGKLLAERSGGRVTYKVFPLSQLGTIARQVEATLLGTQEVFLTPPAFYVGVNQAFMVPDAPGIFLNQKHGNDAIRDPEFKTPFLAAAEDKGVVGAGLIVYEGTSYASTKPIRKPEDIAGLKIRVLASPVERAIPGAWGGTGVPMNFTEVVPAMQRGVVDACRSSIVAMTGLKFQTVAKFTTVSGGGYIPTATWYSKAWLNKLPADIRKMALEIPGELEEEVAEAVRNKVAASHKIWQEAGVELIRFSEADQKRYLAKLRPLGEEILGKHKNPLVRDLYGKLKIVAERHRPKS
ncbi:MAG: TRAP transporter substrate-binding protein [Defluviicoccus sp.]|nr:TRAP transporter substrate-binding protein [Defluviicoccus sp.]